MSRLPLPSFVLAGTLLTIACGGPQEVESAPTSSAAANDPEAACIADANRRAKPRPDRPDSIKVSHILVKHAASKNPVEGVSRTRGQACLRAMEARDAIVGGGSFDETVAKFSDEPGAATRAGSLGDVTRDMLDPAFSDAAFDLDRGQMSDLVETPFGFHLILRTE